MSASKMLTDASQGGFRPWQTLEIGRAAYETPSAARPKCRIERLSGIADVRAAYVARPLRAEKCCKQRLRVGVEHTLTQAMLIGASTKVYGHLIRNNVETRQWP